VGQVGRRIAEFLIQQDAKLAQRHNVDPDRVEAACLAHDLGHPPFGHIGEEELNRLLQGAGVVDGYEGNAQSFRIVTRLSIRHRDFPGLNLTRGTLNGILKYPWFRDLTHPKKKRKFGAYRSDRVCFDWTRVGESVDVLSAEADIMDWADDITYAVHDMEDFYRAGLIPLDKLITDDDEAARFLDWVVARWKSQRRRVAGLDELFNRTVRSTMPLVEIYAGTPNQRAALRSVTASLIGRYIKGLNLTATSRRSGRTRVEQWAREEVDLLKELTWYYVIKNPALATQQYGQQRVLRELFDIFCDAYRTERSDIFPARYRDDVDAMLKQGSLPPDEPYRLIADLLSGMTEAQCMFLHGRLTGRAAGSITDVAVR
jgi:dGTPase